MLPPRERLVGTGRFELPTCRLGGDRSIQLSYVPTISLHCSVRRPLRPMSRAVVHAVEMDLARRRRTRCRWPPRRSSPQAVTPSTRPPAVSRPARAHARAGVEDRGAGGFGGLDAGDRLAGCERARIAARGQHHADADGPGAPFEVALMPSSPSAAASRTGAKSRRQAVHQRLGFRIAQADVELQHLRPVRGHHQAGIQKAGEARGFHGRVDDAVEDLAASARR